MDRADWAPSPADVGAILRARTKDRFGKEAGTFNSDTRPTGDQVVDIIDTITSEINADCGPIPDAVQDYARRTAAIGAAAETELTYWPEQVGSNRSTYDRLYARYMDMFKRLKQQVADLNAGDEPNSSSDLMPLGNFPCDPNPMVGWRNEW